MKAELLLIATALAFPQMTHAAFILNELGNGSVELAPTTGSTRQALISFPSAVTVDRGAAGFGNHTTTVEGVYYTYSFTAPSVADPTGPAGISRFDAQNEMQLASGAGIWSGWGDAKNGPWQNGPTTATWDRGNRRQHLYSGTNGTSTFGGANPPASDLSVPVSNLSKPEFGDQLKVSIYLNAVDNTIFSVYENLTKSESFEYLTTDANIPGGNLSFTRIDFRSDANVSNMNYSYGTLVVPEPSAVCFSALGMLGMLAHRRRN